MTDAEGLYEIAGLAPGTWSVTASHPEWSEATVTVVTAGLTVEKSCQVIPEPEPFVCSDDGKYGNAEVFSALGLLGTVEDNFFNIIVQGQTPEEVRTTTLDGLMAMDRPDVQTMAMMQAFPNLMNFSKTAYGYEHYLVSSALAGSAADADGNGVIDEFAPYLFEMFDDDPGNPGAVNAGLMEFKGFNQPMFLPPDYDWYPPFEDVSDVATMKLPDGKFMKLFLGMQLQMAGVPLEMIEQLIGSFRTAFSDFHAAITSEALPRPCSSSGAGWTTWSSPSRRRPSRGAAPPGWTASSRPWRGCTRRSPRPRSSSRTPPAATRSSSPRRPGTP